MMGSGGTLHGKWEGRAEVVAAGGTGVETVWVHGGPHHLKTENNFLPSTAFDTLWKTLLSPVGSPAVVILCDILFTISRSH